MKPRDPKYSAIPLPEAPSLDASVAYVAARSPISDPVARFQQAEKMKRDHMIKNNKNYWVPWETIYEGNPQQILDRKENGHAAAAPHHAGRARRQRPARRCRRSFAASYRAAGGECQLEIFEGCRAPLSRVETQRAGAR